MRGCLALSPCLSFVTKVRCNCTTDYRKMQLPKTWSVPWLLANAEGRLCQKVLLLFINLSSLQTYQISIICLCSKKWIWIFFYTGCHVKTKSLPLVGLRVLKLQVFSNSWSQLDTSRLSSVKGLVECRAERLKGTSHSNTNFYLRLSALQVDLNYWNNLYYQYFQLYKFILRAESWSIKLTWTILTSKPSALQRGFCVQDSFCLKISLTVNIMKNIYNISSSHKVLTFFKEVPMLYLLWTYASNIANSLNLSKNLTGRAVGISRLILAVLYHIIVILNVSIDVKKYTLLCWKVQFPWATKWILTIRLTS